jgi:hypothetical protein
MLGPLPRAMSKRQKTARTKGRPIARTTLDPMSELGIIVMLIALVWFLFSF